MKKRKICIFTGTRAEYGLLKPLIDELKDEKSVELQLIISGMHLSPEFGYTINDINQAEFGKIETVEMLLSSDTPVGVSKAMGLGMIGYAEALDRLKPDLLVGLGDRFELFSIVSTALVLKIPVAHIHGGELTYGAYDDAFRHSITKMSHLHFASTETYRKRIIQLGENPETVFNVGAIGLDNIKKTKLLTKDELADAIAFKLDKPFFIITFHPVTLEMDTIESQVNALFAAIDAFPEYKIIFTKSNADNGGRAINQQIDTYVQRNNDRIIAFESLGQLRYLSALQYTEMMIGNSSSGIIEMSYFKKPTVNIGNRQKGRLFPDTIIQCGSVKQSIVSAIDKGVSKDFQKKCKDAVTIYGNGTAAPRIKKILLSVNLDDVVKKEFYDL